MVATDNERRFILSYIVGLPNCTETNEAIYISVQDLQPQILFDIDRSIREAVSEKRFLSTKEVENHLSKSGFSIVKPKEEDSVFIHGRPWDDHMMNKGNSFFVLFPETAPFEIAGTIVLATNNASYFANVSADHLYDGKYLLITKDHDPIYVDDLAWATDEQEREIPIGPVFVPREQFATDEQHADAIKGLQDSGYQVAS